jgi:hypothetical protein
MLAILMDRFRICHAGVGAFFRNGIVPALTQLGVRGDLVTFHSDARGDNAASLSGR